MLLGDLVALPGPGIYLLETLISHHHIKHDKIAVPDDVAKKMSDGQLRAKPLGSCFAA